MMQTITSSSPWLWCCFVESLEQKAGLWKESCERDNEKPLKLQQKVPLGALFVKKLKDRKYYAVPTESIEGTVNTVPSNEGKNPDKTTIHFPS